ncbi:hypothetical protein GE061_012034 [Apolygus lucorum]|uniref:Uncharacterized protein n=1 Tax=Apolygus lucorum TaxID=248454 RepID=A0A8S9XR28_APOLU|nr:hypothetical protein GE061_012034 [Apolygus lucorum]
MKQLLGRNTIVRKTCHQNALRDYHSHLYSPVFLEGFGSWLNDVSGFDLTNFDQLDAAKRSPDKLIVIKDLFVPAGKTLDLTELQQGTVIEFSGRVTFGFQHWDGFMVRLKGKNIRVEGKPGNLLDVEGHRWWDGKGGNGGKQKPRFMQVTLDDSIVVGLNIKNTPKDCFIVNWSHNLRVERINIDIKDGHTKGGHNTDGFGVSGSKNVTVSNCQVYNQDDCFATTSGSNYYNSGPKGDPTPFPIHNLVVNNVHGTVSRKGTNIMIWVDPGSVSNWKWNSNVSGGQKVRGCKGVPRELNIPCGKK